MKIKLNKLDDLTIVDIILDASEYSTDDSYYIYDEDKLEGIAKLYLGDNFELVMTTEAKEYRDTTSILVSLYFNAK